MKMLSMPGLRREGHVQRMSDNCQKGAQNTKPKRKKLRNETLVGLVYMPSKRREWINILQCYSRCECPTTESTSRGSKM